MNFGVLEGLRVLLRPAVAEDVTVIEAWYGEAVQAAGISHRRPLSRGAGEGRFTVLEADGALVIERLGDPVPIGMLNYGLGEPEGGWLTVTFIALAKAYRGWGYGSEAVRMLEEWAVREGRAERFRAEVDVRNGLGLYFWLRLGYQPGAGSAGVLRMVRELR